MLFLMKSHCLDMDVFDVSLYLDMMPFSDTKQMWQLSVPMSLDRARSLQQAGPSALHRESLQLCGDWHEPLPKLIGSTMPENVTGYPVLELMLVQFLWPQSLCGLRLALYVALKSCAGQVFDRDPLPQHALQPHEQGDARCVRQDVGSSVYPW